jgi:hypothetical protein
MLSLCHVHVWCGNYCSSQRGCRLSSIPFFCVEQVGTESARVEQDAQTSTELYGEGYYADGQQLVDASSLAKYAVTGNIQLPEGGVASPPMGVIMQFPSAQVSSMQLLVSAAHGTHVTHSQSSARIMHANMS